MGNRGGLVPTRRQVKLALEVSVYHVRRRIIRRCQIIATVLQLTDRTPCGRPGCLLNIAISRSSWCTEL